LLLLVFLMMAILTEVRRNLSMVLSCISFMVRDSKHGQGFFSCVFWPFGLLQLLISLLVHQFVGSLVFLSPLYILIICGWSLQFRDYFFYCAEVFNFM
jgi:hypothetical protein